MKITLTTASMIALAVGFWEGHLGNVATLTVGFVACALLLLFAHLDTIAEFKASGTGIEAKTREVLSRTEVTLRQLQLLTKQIATITLSLVKRNGRIGGYSDDEQDTIKVSVLGILREVGIAESDFSDVLSDWYKFTEFDYAHGILGNGRTPGGADQQALSDWKRLFHSGANSIPSPEDVREFLKKHGFMTSEREELIKDYEHYLGARSHRRIEVWRNRNNWGQLTKAS
jgi:hypothetical protein